MLAFSNKAFLVREFPLSVDQEALDFFSSDLRNKIRPLEIEDLERQITNGAQKDKILAGESLDVFKQRLFSLTDRTAV